MIIETLYIRSFGKLDDLKIDLLGGINIIRGENEAGKSTVCNFIKFIFYGLSGRAEEKLRYISWKTSSAGGYAVVNEGGVRYRIEREVICNTGSDGKPLYRERSTVTDVETNTAVARGQNAGEMFFGVPAEVFESTVYIGQLGDNRVGGRTLAEATENILFSASESVNAKKALKKLDDARVFLMYKNKRGGKLFELQAQKDALTERLEEAQTASGEIINLEGTKRTLGEKLEASKKRLADCSAELELYEKYSAKALWGKRREEEKKRREIEALSEKNRRAENYGGVPVYEDKYINMLEELSRRMDTAAARHDAAQTAFEAASRKVADMSEKIDVFRRLGKKSDERDKRVSKIRTNHDISKKLGLYGLLLAVAAIVFGLCGAAGFFFEFFPSAVCFVLFGLLGICGAGAVITTVLRDPKIRSIKKDCSAFGCRSYDEFEELVAAAMRDEPMLSYITEEKTKASENEKAAADELDAANAKAVSKLTEARFTIEGSTRQSITEALRICRKEKSDFEKITMMLTEQTSKVAEIDDKLRSYDEAFLRDALSTEYDTEKMQNFDAKAERRDYDFLQNSIVAMTEKLSQTDKNLAVLLATNKRPAEISEELMSVSHQLDELTEKFNAYVLAIDSIEAASGKLREGVSPKIAKTASGIMAKLSMGKYDTIGVDSDFSVTFTDDASTHSADSLSAGTSDLAYISLRLALMDVLYTKAHPPLIFDESFSRTDDNRLTAALSLVREFCENNSQSLLFTCHRREEKMMSSLGGYSLVTLGK